MKNSRVRKAVFPAAGLGTRFLPATKAQPKEMLPLVDKPIIQYAVEEALAAGLDQIIMITGRGKYAIEDHFDVAFELEKVLEARDKIDLLKEVRNVHDSIPTMAYVRQKEALGLGHAVLVARALVGDEPFAVLLGDDIMLSEVPCLKQMLDVFYALNGSVVALQQVPRDEISNYGIIAGKRVTDSPFKTPIFRLSDMVEKPKPDEAPSDLAIVGRYILAPEIFNILEETRPGKGGEIQLTDALRRLAQEQPMYGFQFDGVRHDAGSKIGFLKATVDLALRREDLGPEFRAYLKSLPSD
ncbi:MAG: UTP--glucose-1-phosphate uridylyltransferase GalU [Acidobacteria bacterium]|nr:UTP--glucose-1-phosphate uridylyltransferase GalU [Acidobacteriota bacterium]MBI3655935.1 UTP--glucose-1-phosphate uridylyltransferase GalU [Acidobacteriota bacterium]